MFKKFFLLAVLCSFLAACHSAKPVVRTTRNIPQKPVVRNVRKPVRTTPPKQSTSPETNPGQGRSVEVMESTSRTVVYSDVVYAYVDQFKDIAMGNMRSYNIPASIILAQGILESGAGKGDLAITANNHFGIKCHTGWTGETVNHDDDSDQECFRKYKDPAESYRDHALFLTGRSRYSALFQLPKGDYEAWARGLRSAGYATDPKYPEKLITYIEKYNLHQYDAQVMGTDYVPTVPKTKPMEAVAVVDNTSSYEVQKGDTLYSISKKFNLTVEELRQKNGLSDNAISIGQRLRVQ